MMLHDDSMKLCPSTYGSTASGFHNSLVSGLICDFSSVPVIVTCIIELLTFPVFIKTIPNMAETLLYVLEV